jgi:hypothetical protein
MEACAPIKPSIPAQQVNTACHSGRINWLPGSGTAPAPAVDWVYLERGDVMHMLDVLMKCLHHPAIVSAPFWCCCVGFTVLFLLC